MSAPVQVTNVLGFLDDNLLVEWRAVVAERAKVVEQLHNLDDYEGKLRRHARECGINLDGGLDAQ